MTSNIVVNDPALARRRRGERPPPPFHSVPAKGAIGMRLQELIAAQKKDLGLTWDAMVDRARTAGHPLSRSMFHYLAGDEWTNIPTTDSLLAVAAALDVDPDEVLSAAAESVGITTRELHLDRNTRALLALLSDRSPEQIKALEAVIRSVTKAMDAPPADPAE